jgi:hypothetical protein
MLDLVTTGFKNDLSYHWPIYAPQGGLPEAACYAGGDSTTACLFHSFNPKSETGNP